MFMTSYVVDAWAWVEYLRGSEVGQLVKREFELGSEILTSVISMAEVISKFRREGLDAESAWQAVTSLSKTVPVKENDAKEAGIIHATTKKVTPNFSLGDAFVLQTARKQGCRILTGDPDFKRVKEARMLS
jgi:predicted nucleic acid-binding protein